MQDFKKGDKGKTLEGTIVLSVTFPMQDTLPLLDWSMLPLYTLLALQYSNKLARSGFLNMTVQTGLKYKDLLENRLASDFFTWKMLFTAILKYLIWLMFEFQRLAAF